MQYAFFTFSCNGCRDCHDHGYPYSKVDNGWIIFPCLWDCLSVYGKEYYGNWIFIMGSVMPLFLMILFAFGMIGAGDIKLFCALGGIMGCESIIKCIFISFLTGAGISAALLIFNHNFCERILYFIEYVKCTVSTGKISSYRRKSIAAPENFHFTIPVL